MRSWIFILLCFICVQTNAQIVPRPSPEKLYNNLSKAFPNFLDREQAQILENKLEFFSNQTSNQICIVIIDDLNNMEAADYATRIGNEWGVGKKKTNNGIVILVKPTQENGGRKLFIAVGYGLEGAIPDLATKRIRDEEITPYLKQSDYYTALDKGTDKLMALAKGEIDVKDYVRQDFFSDLIMNHPIVIILFVFFLMFILMRILGSAGMTLSRAGRRSGSSIFWGSGGFSGGSFGGYSGGSSSSGGSWGGFGGGSFGGGGSGGSW